MSIATLIVVAIIFAAMIGNRRQRSWGHQLLERVGRLEERIDRLAVGDGTGRDDYQTDELHRLEERVDFLEKLLEERPRRRSLSDDG